MNQYYTRKHRFFRSKMRGKITGVCAGVADHFDVDIVFVRVVAIIGLLLFSATTLVAYVLITLLTDKV